MRFLFYTFFIPISMAYHAIPPNKKAGDILKPPTHRRCAVVLLYSAFYLVTFALLERRSIPCHTIYATIDGAIPFCKYFIIPYVLWFAFCAVTIAYFTLKCENDAEYWQFIGVMGTGTTFFLLISFFFPNAQRLRPVLEGNDLWTQAVKLLYQIDTPTNVFPSLHVFCAIACCCAILKHKQLQKNKCVGTGAVLLTVSIILSTIFLKQHSVIDVTGALILNIICYLIFYKVPTWKSHKLTQKSIYTQKI